MVGSVCEYIKIHLVVHFKRVNCMVFVLYLSKKIIFQNWNSNMKLDFQSKIQVKGSVSPLSLS